jgi:hypothetical protein
MLPVAFLVAFPASAAAVHGHHHHLTPGNSGIDQYTEGIPGLGALALLAVQAQRGPDRAGQS